MKNIFTCILILLQFQLSAQCLIRELPLSQRTSSSELIIEGRVIASNSFWNQDQSMIYTSNTIEVLKVFKGKLVTGTIDIITEGGVVGLRMIKVDPSLSLKKGMVGIFLLETVKRAKNLQAGPGGIPRYEAYGSVQGFIKYNLQDGTAADPFKKYRSIQNELYKTFSPLMNYKVLKAFDIREQSGTFRIQSISGFTPTTINAGVGAVLTINGINFGATRGTGTVRFRNSDDGGASYITPLPSQYLTWSNTQITVEVPSGAGTGDIQVTQGASTFTSAGTLTIEYAHTNLDFDAGAGDMAWQTAHFDVNGTGGYTWQMNTAFDANAAARASFMRAFDSWRCSTGINWTIGATTTANSIADDDINVISFDDAAPLGPGLLGVCQSWYTGCFTGPTTIAWFADELDIVFDNGDNFDPLTWEFGPATPSGSEYDFESVALHELGHGHQLVHVINAGAVMHYALGNGVTSRSLSAADLAGANFVQAKSEGPNACGAPSMTAFAGCSALPLTITSVNAFQKLHGVQVEWTNESESDVHHYEVEESANGSAFTIAATVTPTGNNSNRASYEWFDAQVMNGSNYYRVKAVGISGEIKFSGVVTVNFAGNNKTFNAYPNPVSGRSFTVAFNNLQKGTYTLSMYNQVGQRLVTRTLVHAGGNAVHNINVAGLAPGLYSLKLDGNHINEKPLIITIN